MTAPQQGWAPPPPSKGGGGGFLRRKGVQLAGTGLAGLLLGTALGGGASESADTTTAAPADDASQQRITSLEQQLAAANERVETVEAATAAPAPPSPPPAPAPPPPPPAAAPAQGDLSDGSFSSTEPILTDSFGSFGGTARVTNDSGNDVQGAILTFTLFKGGAQVGTLQGSVSDVAADETQTVQLISTDDFAGGVDRFEFQVDTEF